MEKSLYLKQLEVGPMQNFVYLIGDLETREAVIVDPAWDIGEVVDTAKADGMNIKAALVTHAHFDHVNGLEPLLALFNIPIYVNKHEAEFLKNVKGHLKKVDDGDHLQVGNLQIQFLHTPGHTPGSQCFMVHQNLVSGDTLFIHACGRCDLPGGDPVQMYHSLNRLAALDNQTVLFPGHNYAEEPTSTIGDEKKTNPYLQAETLKSFLHARMGE